MNGFPGASNAAGGRPLACPANLQGKQCTPFVLRSQYVLFGTGVLAPFHPGWPLLNFAVVPFWGMVPLQKTEGPMRLDCAFTTMRGGWIGRVEFQEDLITDNDTGKVVGFVKASRSPATRHVSLFGGKYQGDFRTIEECCAFIKGVEVVLNHVVQIEGEPTEAHEAA
jgi:hypothetical protein